MSDEQIARLLQALHELWVASDRAPRAGRALNDLRSALGLESKPEYQS